VPHSVVGLHYEEEVKLKKKRSNNDLNPVFTSKQTKRMSPSPLNKRKSTYVISNENPMTRQKQSTMHRGNFSIKSLHSLSNGNLDDCKYNKIYVYFILINIFVFCMFILIYIIIIARTDIVSDVQLKHMFDKMKNDIGKKDVKYYNYKFIKLHTIINIIKKIYISD